MKILYIVSGGHLYGDNKSLLQSIIAMKNTITPLVCVAGDGVMIDELKQNDIQYVKIKNTMTPHLIKIGETKIFYRVLRFPFFVTRSILTFFKLVSICNTFKPNIVHSNNGLIYAGSLLSRFKRIPHVWHLREYIDKDHAIQLPFKKYFLRNIKKSYCIAVSKGVFEHWRLETEKDVIMYDGIFSEKEVLPYCKNKEKYFIFSGRLIPTKGLKELVETFIEFSRENTSYKLLIAGEGDENYTKSIKEIIKNTKVNVKIEFLGFVRDIRPLFSKAKALFVPSYFEAQGRITAEAMLLGCYVIGRNTAGTRELLENEQAGILYNTNSELLEAIKKVVSLDDHEMEITNLKIQESSKKRYTCERNAVNMLNFYNNIINKQNNT